MKYMGSKRAMLQNGLGELMRTHADGASRIVDLFCGAASVAWFAATQLRKPVAAFDLQRYAAVLAGCVVRRTRALDAKQVEDDWVARAEQGRTAMPCWKAALKLDSRRFNTATWRARAQELCESDPAGRDLLVWRCYGGHYFSPTQALAFDAMLRALPRDEELREVCLAAVIVAASRCAAAPGHTAQPFKATRSAGRYLREAWLRDPFAYASQAARDICPLHASVRGEASVGDANEVANTVRRDDLVFLDPPYSGVHYSRFYHVLETIAQGQCGPVEGTGRYPPPADRPNSLYSRKDSSRAAMSELLCTLADKRCRVILTFPRGVASNGLSGRKLIAMAQEYFDVVTRAVKTRFSTLGGNLTNRRARKMSHELILVLQPR